MKYGGKMNWIKTLRQSIFCQNHPEIATSNPALWSGGPIMQHARFEDLCFWFLFEKSLIQLNCGVIIFILRVWKLINVIWYLHFINIEIQCQLSLATNSRMNCFDKLSEYAKKNWTPKKQADEAALSLFLMHLKSVQNMVKSYRQADNDSDHDCARRRRMEELPYFSLRMKARWIWYVDP